MNDYVSYLQKNKMNLVGQWVKVLRDGGLFGENPPPKLSEELSSRIFDAFIAIVEENNYPLMESIIEEVIEKNLLIQGPFMEVRKALSLSSVRSTLLSEVLQRYKADELYSVLMHINSAIDRMISDYIKQLEAKSAMYSAYTGELDEFKKNYEIIFGEMSDGCFINQDGKIIFANRAFCAMHGYRHNEIIGKSCMELLEEGSRDTILERFNRQLKGDVPFSRYIYLRQDKKGNKFFTENRAKLIRYNDKPAVLGLCTDITERMEMEEKVRQKESLVLIGRLTASIAHEIRNRLSAINVDLQILQNTLELEGNDRRRLEIVHEQFGHLGNFVSQMMEFAGPLKLQYDSAYVDDLIDLLITSVRGRADKEEITLIKKIALNLPSITVDKKKIVEALENISINALDAMTSENGFKQKLIEMSANFRIHSGKKYVDMSIRDNGIGIPPEDKEHIFSPFFTRGKKNGIGLGLSIVERTINAHQGFVMVESEKAQGTCFHLLIPVDRA